MTQRILRALLLSVAAAVALSWHMHLGAQSAAARCGAGCTAAVDTPSDRSEPLDSPHADASARTASAPPTPRLRRGLAEAFPRRRNRHDPLPLDIARDDRDASAALTPHALADTRLEAQAELWTVKPPAGTAIDVSNPLASQLVGAWHIDQGLPVNLVNPALSGVYRGAPALVPTQDGIGSVATTDGDYLEVADPAHLLNFSTGPFSIAVDFYYGTADPGAVLVGRDRSLVDGYAIQTANDSGGRKVLAAINHSPTADTIQTGDVLRIGEINRVLVTYSGSMATIYVNGVSAASGAYAPPRLAPENLFVGRDASFGGLNFNNPITRLAMWNRPLTPAEAQQITHTDPYAYMVAPSATQPAISAVSVGAVTSTSVTIGWTTNVPANSLVQYGPTIAYASRTALDPALTTVHGQLLTGLTPGALYHYQVVSRDATGAIVASADSTFTALSGLAFADDFNGATLDLNAWTALNRPGDSGTGELQYYQPGNATVSQGSIGMTANVDPSEPGYDYTSAMVQWPAFNYRYGTLEIRAKLTGGTGPWPAFRLLGTNCQQSNILTAGSTGACNAPQPGSDEIAVAAILNSNLLAVNQRMDSGAISGSCQPLVADVSQNWHTYALVWSPGSLEWKIDGATTCTLTNGVPSTPMFLVMNAALGGIGGGPINDATLPQTMTVDYVRVYEQTDTQAPTVAGVSPGGGATGVSLTTAVTSRFSEAMAAATINPGTMLLQAGSTPVPATVTYTPATRTATLTPIAPLASLTAYTVTVRGGATGVADPAGNPLASDATWSFMTTTDIPPVITSLSPVSGAVGTLVTITGTGFGPGPATGSVTVNGAAATPTSWSPTSIVAPVPFGATTGSLVVTVGGRPSNAALFTVTIPAPTITSLSPSSGLPGTTVTIAGANLVTDLLAGKIGWWGPFASGVAPDNLITGMPDGQFVGAPAFTTAGGGAFTSDGSNYLAIPDGGPGGTYDWTSGAWSAQVDFLFPATPVFSGSNHPILLVSKGSYALGTGWEIQINDSVLNGKYQIMLESNHGIGSYHVVVAYQVVPGAFNRAVIVCDEAGNGTWYVNGSPWSSQPCAPSQSGATDLLIGRYSGTPAFPASFPISRVQIWNRALSPAEAVLTTTTDPIGSTVTFNGTAAAPTSYSSTSIVASVPSGATTGPVVVTAGGQASNGISFTVPPNVTNTPPTVSAGAAQSVESGTLVSLSGSASDSNTPPLALTLEWTQTAGPAVTLVNATTATPTFTAPTLAPGAAAVTLGFRLTANNGVLTGTATTTVTVLAPVAPPTATAGAAQTVQSGAPVTLTGTGSDPNTPPRALTFAWTQTSGTPVTLTGATTLTPTFTAPTLAAGAAAVTLGFRLTANNGVLTGTATTTVTVLAPVAAPTATAGAAQTVQSGAPVTLTGTGSDPNTPPRALTFAWTQTSGTAVTLTGATTLTPTFTAPTLAAGAAAVTLGFRLTANNGVLTGTATTTVTVLAPVAAPTATGGAAQTVQSGAPVTLTGTGSDPNTPPRALTFAWTQTSGTPVTLTGATTLSPTFTAPTLAAGAAAVTLGFRLTANNGVLTGTATTTVTVLAPVAAPTATGGAAQTVQSGAPVTLTGTGSDPNTPPRALTFAWTQTSGTPVTLTGATTLTPTFTAPTLAAGAAAVTLGFTLTVNNGVLTGTATTTVTVLAPVAAPTATGGAAQTVQSGAPVTLTGTGSDPNTPPRALTFAWTQTSGTPVTLTGATTLSPTFTAPTLAAGAAAVTLGFRLTANNGVLTGTATTTVTVLAPVAAPTATGGAAQTVQSGAPVTLTGTGSDPNTPPRALTFAWTQTSGTPVTLTGATTLSPTFTAPTLAAGAAAVTLGFRLTANNGVLTGTATTTVTVLAPVAAPTATGGAAQTVQSGAPVTLTGTGSDPNTPPRALTFAWTQTSGTPVTLTGATTLTPTFTAPTLAAGAAAVTLGFTLTVNNGVLTGTATTTVTVLAPVAAPTATGGAAQTVQSGAPVTLTGTGSDPNTPPRALTFAWTQTSGTPVTLTGATTLSPTFTAPTLAAGAAAVTLGFRLTANNGVLTGTATTTVTVLAPVAAPTATGGAAQTVQSGAPVTLTGTGSDPNTPPRALTFAWTQTSGTPVTLTGATTLSPTFTAPTLAAGAAAVTLGFRLTANNGVLTGTATTTVTVLAPVAAPTATGGAAQTVQSGAPVTLTGTGSDPNTPPRALTFAWTQTSGTPVTLTGATTLTPTFTAPTLAAGAAAVTLGFRLTANNGVLTGTATTAVTVLAPVAAPTATAGAAQTVQSGAPVTLTGTGSDPNTPPRALTFAWTQTSGTAVTLTGATTLTPTFTAPTLAAGAAAVTLGFRLTANNGVLAGTATTTVTVLAGVAPPTATAGAAQTVQSGAPVALTGTGSDPNTPPRALTFAWTQTSGTPVTLTGATTLTPTFTAPTLAAGAAAVTLGFRLTANNGVLTGTATTTVTVLAPVAAPTATAGAAQTVQSGAPVTLTGTGSDPNTPPRALTFAWMQTSGTAVTLTGATTLTPTFTAPTLAAGAAAVTLGFRLTANNGVLTGTATTTVTVLAPVAPPTATAGAAQTVQSGAPVTLTGTGSDPNTPPRALTFAWTQTSGTAVTLTGATTLSPTFTAPTLAAGAAAVTLGFRLTANNGVLTGTATTTVTVLAPVAAPTATAGAAQTVQSGAPVTLTGTGSDPNTPPRALTFAWTQTSGTAVTLTGATTLSPTFTAPTLAAGAAAVTLGFRLTANNGVLTGTATTTVTVLAPVAAPTATGGAAQTVQSGAPVTLTGTGSDPNTPPRALTFAWTQTSGTPVTLTGATTLSPTFTAPTLAAGAAAVTLGFRLTANNGVLTGTATTTVTVLAPVAAPTATAGAAQTVQSGAPVTLTGTGSDPNTPPRALTFAWMQTSGTAVTLTGATTLTPTFTAPTLAAGAAAVTLNFTLTANNGVLAGTATTTVTVLAGVAPPTATAGAAQTVQSGAPVTLTGTGSDPNTPPRALTFAWTQTSGTPVTLTGATTLTPTFTAPTLAAGAAAVTLGFRLTANNGVLTGTATTTVTVLAPVAAPTATAGAAQTVQSGAPVTLTGTGSDPNTPPRALTFAWTQTSGTPVTLTNANTAVATFTTPTLAPGAASVTLGFSFTANNGVLTSSATTTVVVLAPVAAPNAATGAPQTVPSNSPVTLTGSASDPNTPPRSLTVNWTQTSGTPVTLTNANTAVATFTTPTLAPGAASMTLGFSFTANNGVLTSSATTTVVVLAPVAAPNAATGAPQTVPSNSPVTLTGSASDPNTPPRSLTVNWTQTSGTPVTLTNANTAAATFTTPTLAPGAASVTLGFSFTANNGVLTSTAPTTVTVLAPVAPPTAGAGAPQTVQSGAAVTLNGTSTDSNTPPRPLTVAWTQASETPVVTLSNATSATATFTAPTLPAGAVPVTLHFTYTVNNGVLSTPATTTVRVLPPVVAPSANAGAPQTVQSGAAMALAGTGSDPNTPPRPLTYAWTQTEGPAVTLTGAATNVPTFTAPELAAGAPPVTLVFGLAISNGVLTSTAATSVVVQSPLPPLVAAQTVFADGPGAQTVAHLNASAGDLLVAFVSTDGPEGLPQSTAVAGGGLTWTLRQRVSTQQGASEIWTATPAEALIDVSVTAAQAIASSATGSAFVESLAVATFPRGRVGASSGASATTGAASASLDTTAAGSLVFAVGNDATLAAARTVAADQAVLHEYLALDASSHWLQTLAGGPVPSQQTTLTLRVVAPIVNRWNLAAIEIVNRGAPVVDAGAAQTVAPAAGVTLTGTATDLNVPTRALTYLWTQAAGPAVTLANPSAAVAGFTAPAVAPGESTTLVFTLTVSNGALATEAMTTVTVNASPTVTSTTPASGAVGIPTATTVTATFSESIDPTSITAATMTLRDAGNAPVTASVTYTASNRTATLTPLVPLGNLVTYTANVKGGIGGAATTIGAPLPSDYSWTFTTVADTTPPVMSVPKAVPSTVTALITWTTDELSTSRVDYGTSPQSLTLTANNATLVTAHSVLLPGLSPNTTYYFRATSADAALNVSTAPASPNPPSGFFISNAAGLVAAYGFEEGVGGTVADLSGAGNPGTISGATWTTGGRYGSALSFDGITNWVTVDNAPAFDLTSAVTLEAWVKPASTSGSEAILYKERPAPLDAGLSWGLYSSDSDGPPGLYAAIPSNPWAHVNGLAPLAVNTWTHIAASYNGTAFKMYVNGVLVRTSAISGGSVIPSTGPLRIGGNSISIPFGGQYFKGLIDEIRVYNRDLSLAEIQADMATPLALTVTAVTPPLAATNVPITSVVTATFSKALAVGTIGPATVWLTGAPGDVPIAAAVAYNATTRTVTLTPTSPLATATTYTAMVKGGTGGVTSTTGTPLAADYRWTFTTVAPDVTPPVMSALKAAPGTTTALITWSTDELSTTRVDYGTSPEALTLSASNGTLVTAHSVLLPGLSTTTTYYFRVTSADAASNSSTAPVVSSAPSSFSTANPAGLVAAFDFNEGVGGTVADLSGAGNHGTISGATWTTGGRYGSALSFDGVSNWVSVDNASSLQLTTGMTLEAWVKPASGSGWDAVLYKERPAQDAGLSWGLYSSDGSAPPAIYAATAAGPWSHATGTSLLPLNTWTHLVGTYNGTVLRLYVNGVLVRTVALSGSMLPSTGPLRIGGNAISIPFGGQYFKGLIDEIRIYNRALSQAEIQADMTTPVR